MKADLHVHTNQSDGSFSSKEVVDLAISRGVNILAITDHDTVSGIQSALNSSYNKNIKVIPGIEISASVGDSDDEIHIVGLNIDFKNSKIEALSNSALEFKHLKTKKRLELINARFGSNITYDEIKAKTLGEPGGPHIAMVLLEKHYILDIKEGILLMTKGGPCEVHLEKKPIQAKEAIEIIHNSGGIAILAHLSAYKNLKKFVTFEEQENLVKQLKAQGLDGIEIYIPEASEEDIKFGNKLAETYKLLVSGGSDFHDEKFIPLSKLGFLEVNSAKLTVLNKFLNIQ
jgi:predicted metal-dependent phosphoesterase TrpH